MGGSARRWYRRLGGPAGALHGLVAVVLLVVAVGSAGAHGSSGGVRCHSTNDGSSSSAAGRGLGRPR